MFLRFRIPTWLSASSIYNLGGRGWVLIIFGTSREELLAEKLKKSIFWNQKKRFSGILERKSQLQLYFVNCKPPTSYESSYDTFKNSSWRSSRLKNPILYILRCKTHVGSCFLFHIGFMLFPVSYWFHIGCFFQKNRKYGNFFLIYATRVGALESPDLGGPYRYLGHLLLTSSKYFRSSWSQQVFEKWVKSEVKSRNFEQIFSKIKIFIFPGF